MKSKSLFVNQSDYQSYNSAHFKLLIYLRSKTAIGKMALFNFELSGSPYI